MDGVGPLRWPGPADGGAGHNEVRRVPAGGPAAVSTGVARSGSEPLKRFWGRILVNPVISTAAGVGDPRSSWS
jgi:hypothetical protein